MVYSEKIGEYLGNLRYSLLLFISNIILLYRNFFRFHPLLLYLGMKIIIGYLLIGVFWTMHLDNIDRKLQGLQSSEEEVESRMNWGLRIGTILLWPVSVFGALTVYVGNNDDENNIGNGYAS